MSKESVVIEIRAGSGGDEAKAFVGILTRMYLKYATRVDVGWTISALDEADSMTTFMLEGDGVSKMRSEIGVQCIQRIPPNRRTSGKVHTTTATVAVLPVTAETQSLAIDANEYRTETMRGTGKGGQNRNKVESAVRIVHLPTGLSAICRDERSQASNRERAMKVLTARVDAHLNNQFASKMDQMRRSQVLTGMRAERFRTYDVPEDRLIDRRSGKKINGLSRIFDGRLDDVLEVGRD